MVLSNPHEELLILAVYKLRVTTCTSLDQIGPGRITTFRNRDLAELRELITGMEKHRFFCRFLPRDAL